MSMFLAEALLETFYDTRKTATAIVRGLLLQLVQQYLRLIEHVLSQYEERKARLFDSFDALRDMFLKACADTATGRKYCVVDALDERAQDDQMTLLKKIKETRPYAEVTEYLQAFPNRDLASFEESKRDIDKFISEKVAGLKGMKKYFLPVTEMVTGILRDKAGGIVL
ncbi:hypothetical protein ACHAQA_009715 [Verticillium albo-atrum]